MGMIRKRESSRVKRALDMVDRMMTAPNRKFPHDDAANLRHYLHREGMHWHIRPGTLRTWYDMRHAKDASKRPQTDANTVAPDGMTYGCHAIAQIPLPPTPAA